MTGQTDLGGLPPNREPNRLLREQRRARGWKQDDVAAGIEDLAQQLAEPMPLITAGLVDKWERGVRRPGRYYAPRLCLLFGLPPRELGFAVSPRLVADCRRLSAALGAEPGIRIGAPSEDSASGHVDAMGVDATGHVTATTPLGTEQRDAPTETLWRPA